MHANQRELKEQSNRKMMMMKNQESLPLINHSNLFTATDAKGAKEDQDGIEGHQGARSSVATHEQLVQAQQEHRIN